MFRALAAAVLVISFGAVAPSSATETTTFTRFEIEYQLDELKLPTGAVNYRWDEKTKRGLCAWRELNGLPVHRKMPTVEEQALIMSTTKLPLPATLKVGLNINRQCQVLYWVTQNSTTLKKSLKGVFPVSSGAPGYDNTASGTYPIKRRINSWHESTLYEDAMMYRPMYFRGPVALHGSAVDSLVKPYPASHGCVRMLHKHIDAMWSGGVRIGTPVHIYGMWTDPIRWGY